MSSLGRDAVASVSPSLSIRIPIVEVVPISRPSRTAIGLPGLSDQVHEAFHAVAIDRVEGLAVDLEMGPDDAAIADRENLAHGVDIDPGIGEDRRIADRLF